MKLKSKKKCFSVRDVTICNNEGSFEVDGKKYDVTDDQMTIAIVIIKRKY